MPSKKEKRRQSRRRRWIRKNMVQLIALLIQILTLLFQTL